MNIKACLILLEGRDSHLVDLRSSEVIMLEGPLQSNSIATCNMQCDMADDKLGLYASCGWDPILGPRETTFGSTVDLRLLAVRILLSRQERGCSTADL